MTNGDSRAPTQYRAPFPARCRADRRHPAGRVHRDHPLIRLLRQRRQQHFAGSRGQ